MPSQNVSLHTPSSDGRGTALVSIEAAKFGISEALSHFPSKFKRETEALLLGAIEYFREPKHLVTLQNRLKKFGKQISNDLSAEILGNHNESLAHSLGLMITNGTLKELVWENSIDSRRKLESLSIRSCPLMNIFSGEQASLALGKIANSEFLRNTQQLSDQLEFLTGHPLADFLREPRLSDLFADEVIASIRVTVNSRIHALPENHEKRAQLQQVLVEFTADQVGESSYVWSPRNILALRAGDRSGDCTAPGSSNYWTVGTWNSLFENFELESYHENRFYARYLGILGESAVHRPSAWIHAVEFTPLARTATSKSTLKDPGLQRTLLRDNLTFLAKKLRQAGIQDIYVTNISNSQGFTNLLGSIVDQSLPLSSAIFTLLSSLESCHRISDLFGINAHRKIPIYLQGWAGSSNFPRKVDPDSTFQKSDAIFLGDKEIAKATMFQVSRAFMAMVQDDLKEEQAKLWKLSWEQYRELLCQALFSKNPTQLFDDAVREFEETARRLTLLFDPGAIADTNKALLKASKSWPKTRAALDRKVTLSLPTIAKEVAEDFLYKTVVLKEDKQRAKEALSQDTFYRGRVPPYYLDDPFWESIPVPHHDEYKSQDKFLQRWKSAYKLGVVDRAKPLGEFKSRRPSAIAHLEAHFDKLLDQYISLENVNAEQLFIVAKRIRPSLLNEMQGYLANHTEIPSAERELLLAHVPAVLDFYMKTSQQNDHRVNLTSEVTGYNIRQLVP